jgi:hypothetical protein
MSEAIIQELDLSESTINKIDEELSRAYEQGMSEDKIKMAVFMMVERMRYLRKIVTGIKQQFSHGMKKHDVVYILKQIQNNEFIFDETKKILKIRSLVHGLKDYEMAYIIKGVS